MTETLEVIPRQWKVVQTVRERFACRACEAVTQPPAPFHATPRGMFGPSFLAMVMFEKFGTHQPLNRQRDRYAREGVEISLSTLADQGGACAAALAPLHRLIEAHVLAAERLHGDDTTVPVLAKTKADVGRLWTYVRDDRPFAGPAPPAALFHYSRTRRADHPVGHLADYRGILQADAYAGYNALFRGGRLPSPLTRALCWAHARRKFFELADVAAQLKRRRGAAVISPIAAEAVRRIDRVFDVERTINGTAVTERLAVRREIAALLVTDLELWLRSQRAALARHNPVSGAIDYMLKDWTAFARFLDDGRICLTNNAAERALRGVALGRKAWLFAGSDRGGERAGFMYTLIGTAKLFSETANGTRNVATMVASPSIDAIPAGAPMGCCDREAMGHVATTAGITAEDVRDLMVATVEHRYGQVNRVPEPIEWLTDNPVLSLSKGTVAIPHAIPARSPVTSGWCRVRRRLAARSRTVWRRRSSER